MKMQEKGRTVTKSYDIDVGNSFWAKNASLPLPEVGCNIILTSIYR